MTKAERIVLNILFGQGSSNVIDEAWLDELRVGHVPYSMSMRFSDWVLVTESILAGKDEEILG